MNENVSRRAAGLDERCASRSIAIEYARERRFFERKDVEVEKKEIRNNEEKRGVSGSRQQNETESREAGGKQKRKSEKMRAADRRSRTAGDRVAAENGG